MWGRGRGFSPYSSVTRVGSDLTTATQPPRGRASNLIVESKSKRHGTALCKSQGHTCALDASAAAYAVQHAPPQTITTPWTSLHSALAIVKTIVSTSLHPFSPHSQCSQFPPSASNRLPPPLVQPILPLSHNSLSLSPHRSRRNEKETESCAAITGGGRGAGGTRVAGVTGAYLNIDPRCCRQQP